MVHLEAGVNALVDALPPPIFNGEMFRYSPEHCTSQCMQILKSVRVVSGLHGAIVLGKVGLHQEGYSVLRVVSEAIQDIEVLDEAHYSKSGPTTAQKDLLNHFFGSDDAERTKAILEGTSKPLPRVTRKQKRAQVERLLIPHLKPGTHIGRSLEALDNLLDGFLHCGYGEIMDSYFVTPLGGGFKLRGISHPGRHRGYVTFLAGVVHPALNTVAKLMREAGGEDLAQALIATRKRLEVSPEYR